MSTMPRDGVHPRGLAALSVLLVAAVVVLCGLSLASAPADAGDPVGSSSASVAAMPGMSGMSGMSGMDAGEDCPVACAEDLAPACAVLVAVLGLGLLGLLLAGHRDTFLARMPRTANAAGRPGQRHRWPRGALDLAELCVLRI